MQNSDANAMKKCVDIEAINKGGWANNVFELE